MSDAKQPDASPEVKPKVKKKSVSARSRARQRVLQALYQWQMAKQDILKIEIQFMQEQDMKRVDKAYFKHLLHAIPAKVAQLDLTITPFLDRSLDQLDPIELAILRIGAYELTETDNLPWRVAINEAVELAKRFGAEQSHKYVNGVLDQLAKKLLNQDT